MYRLTNSVWCLRFPLVTPSWFCHGDAALFVDFIGSSSDKCVELIYPVSREETQCQRFGTKRCAMIQQPCTYLFVPSFSRLYSFLFIVIHYTSLAMAYMLFVPNANAVGPIYYRPPCCTYVGCWPRHMVLFLRLNLCQTAVCQVRLIKSKTLLKAFS